MANLHHTVGQVEGSGALFIAFKILDTSGTPSIVNVSSPLFFTGDVTVADTATGRATVSITNFKAPRGFALPFVQSLTTSVSSAVVASSVAYSGDTLSFEVSSEDDASTLTDTSVNVQVWAF